MSEENPISQATNPKQYDAPGNTWHQAAVAESPRNTLLLEYLDRYIKSWKGKRFLDIGSGTGWVLDVAKNAGAARVLGIEPSERHVSISKQQFPDTEVIGASFEEFNPAEGELFDKAISLWTLPHIKDLDAFFEKASSLLDQNGELLIVVPDYDYYIQPRHGYQMEIIDKPEGTYVMVTRPGEGTVADLVRPNPTYIAAAQKAGLERVEEVAMRPSDSYVASSPRYQEYYDVPVSQLLRFKKRAK
jgi:SAM-dependent methyltransferase